MFAISLQAPYRGPPFRQHLQKVVMSDGRALEILKEPYAKGELTREQFEPTRRAIES